MSSAVTTTYRVREANGASTTTTIEELYKCFGVLADAKDDAGKVGQFNHLFQ